MTKQEQPYNPLDKRHLAENVAQKLLERPVEQLPPGEAFVGAGLYAIYYLGKFPLYAPIAKANSGRDCTQPIYVGKAVPAGARKGGYGLGEDSGQVLFNRLKEHADSIRQAKNLDLSDFRCRYLVADDIWIPLGEAMIIERFHPLWNKQLDGFGNHDPGAGRYKQQRAPWDTLHPGRAWADRLRPSKRPLAEIEGGVRDFLKQRG